MCSASFSAISSVVVSSMKVRLSHIIVRRNGTTMSTTWSFAWKRLRSLWTIAHLRNKILFTLGLLLIYRVLAHILVPLTHQEQVNLVNLFGSNKIDQIDLFLMGQRHKNMGEDAVDQQQPQGEENLVA